MDASIIKSSVFLEKTKTKTVFIYKKVSWIAVCTTLASHLCSYCWHELYICSLSPISSISLYYFNNYYGMVINIIVLLRPNSSHTLMFIKYTKFWQFPLKSESPVCCCFMFQALRSEIFLSFKTRNEYYFQLWIHYFLLVSCNIIITNKEIFWMDRQKRIFPNKYPDLPIYAIAVL